MKETIKPVEALMKLYNKNIYPVEINPSVIVRDKRTMFHYILSNTPLGFELWTRISTNYLQLKTIYLQRKNHNLFDWEEDFCNFIKSLPESELITRL